MRHILGKELRASDVDGAPLLFQAAASNNIECFKEVYDCVKEVLGDEEIMEQLHAKDKLSRTILFPTVKHGAIGVFHEILKSTREGFLSHVDKMGMSLVHYAARHAEDGEMLRRVVEAHCEEDSSECFKQPDRRGMTPLRHLFRNKSKSSREGLEGKLEVINAGEHLVGKQQLTEVWESSVSDPRGFGTLHHYYGASRCRHKN